MPIQVGEFLAVLERLAPAGLAEDWDNCGLQAGALDIESGCVLAALDATEEVLEEAEALGCRLLLTHHPLIFRPLGSVSDESEAGRLARLATIKGIAVVSAHTNLDAAPGGLADVMAEMVGLERIEPISALAGGSMFKLVVFVPEKDLGPVRAALFEAGAGVIGDYRHCSYYSAGTGTFLPVEGAEPTIGEVGVDESVAELRLETLVPESCLERAVEAVAAAHSYEEPAYDIYPLKTMRGNAGIGRVGELPEPERIGELARRVAATFGLDEARFTAAGMDTISRVAVVPGSGAGFIGSCQGRADVLITGDIRYHDAFEARGSGIALIDIPHDVSESAAFERWLPRLGEELAGRGVAVRYSSAATGVWESGRSTKEATIRETASKGNHRLHVDGGSRGNPGPAGIGAVLLDGEGNVVDSLAEYIGEATNNIAEYRSLIAGLRMAIERGIRDIDVYSDSELIIRQLEGRYRVKNEGLRPLYQEAKDLLSKLDRFRLVAVPREHNAHADELVNKALDESGN